MTAQQLIAILAQCDPLSPVYVSIGDDVYKIDTVDDNVSSIVIVPGGKE